MRKKSTDRKPAEVTASKAKPGKKSTSPEEKATVAKADNLQPKLVLQYQGAEVDMTTLADAAQADFHKENGNILVTDLKLYVKPEDGTAYYVINEEFKGQIIF